MEDRWMKLAKSSPRWRVLFTGSIVLLVAITVLSIQGFVRDAAASLTYSPGVTQMTDQFSGNTNLFPAGVYAKSYSVISDYGTSTGNEYVIYSPTASATLTYMFYYLNVHQDSDNTKTYSQSNICNNMDSSGSNGNFHVKLEVDYTTTPGIDVSFYNKTSSFADKEKAICADGSNGSTFNISVPSTAFSYDAETGMYRAYFTTKFSYRWKATGTWRSDWSSTYSSSHMGQSGAKLAHQWSVNSTSLLSYGKQTVSDANPARTVVVASNKDANLSAKFPFGLSCSALSQTKTITLYDFDNKSDNDKDVSFSIHKQAANGTWQKILLRNNNDDNVSITDPQSSGQQWSDGDKQYRPGNGSGLNVTVSLTLVANTKYYIELHKFNSKDINYYEIGIPTDGVYGSSNFACPPPPPPPP
ncbi:MAG TPA: hypothetical protein PKD68_03920, partial [Candidatus Saccharibacteria bacterium]|nr:hypothetical protein [Candidatus Saccharibacteria bacterium]